MSGRLLAASIDSKGSLDQLRVCTEDGQRSSWYSVAHQGAVLHNQQVGCDF